MTSLSIDIGGTFIKYAKIDKSMNIIEEWNKETKKMTDKDAFYNYICEGITTKDIDYIGVSAPGVIDSDSTVLSRAAYSVRAMYLSNVNDEISKRLGVPTQTINDGKSAAYCELKIGNGKNSKSSAYFIIGTGIGGCLCNGQEIIEGVDRMAGEFSNIPVRYYKDRPSKLMGLGKIASMSALIEIYSKKGDNKVRYGKEITKRFLKGQKEAEEAIDEWCRNIVMGLYMITLMYNPEVICIGGGISEEKWFIDKVKHIYSYEIQLISEPKITTRIERCKFNGSANLLGASLYAYNNLKNDLNYKI